MTDIIDAVTAGERLHQDGFLIQRGLLDHRTVARLRSVAESFVKRRRTGGVVKEVAKPKGEAVEPVTSFQCNHPDYWTLDSAGLTQLLRTAVDPRVMTLPRLALGADAMYRCMSIWFSPLTDVGQGAWHRDIQFHFPNDVMEEQKQFLLGQMHQHRMVQLQIALIPSDHVEVVPGSHRNWDTPEQLAIRHGDNGARAKGDGMPGAMRVDLAAGDAVLFRNVMMHRGSYSHTKPRLTLMLSYLASHACLDDHFSQQPWFLRSGYLDGLDDASRQQYERFIAAHRGWWPSQQTSDVCVNEPLEIR